MDGKIIAVASQMSTAAEMAATMTEVSDVEVKADLMAENEIQERKDTSKLSPPHSIRDDKTNPKTRFLWCRRIPPSNCPPLD